jgi:hypothetical protein
MSGNASRRDVLMASLASLGIEAAGAQNAPPKAGMADVKFEARDAVRIGVIGVGARGNSLIDNFSALPQVRIAALCDVIQSKTEAAAARLVKAGKPAPALYHSGNHAYEKLVARNDIDLAIVATPWIWHVPMAVAAMRSGKHVGVEVPAARTLAECWTLVNVSEATRRHCMILENCCYGETELMALLMARDGLFGELTHAACAYNHDLRSVLFDQAGEGLWRRLENETRNGNLYPTHGFGPVCNYLDVNRGDRLETLVSMSSLSAGLQAYRRTKLPAADPRQKETYRNGDCNISLVRTSRGRLIQLEHNVADPQPYDRINLIAGTGGIFRDYPPRIYIDGARGDAFGPLDPYREKYQHPYWKKVGELAKQLGGHGGMDFVMAYRIVECMTAGAVPDINVYDAAAWSAAAPLSERSVAKGGAPQQYPDFTRGGWRTQARNMPV